MHPSGTFLAVHKPVVLQGPLLAIRGILQPFAAACGREKKLFAALPGPSQHLVQAPMVRLEISVFEALRGPSCCFSRHHKNQTLEGK